MGKSELINHGSEVRGSFSRPSDFCRFIRSTKVLYIFL